MVRDSEVEQVFNHAFGALRLLINHTVDMIFVSKINYLYRCPFNFYNKESVAFKFRGFLKTKYTFLL